MKVLVIGGPTASGKSELAFSLAKALLQSGVRAGIFCADSVTVFRGLDIGSAKPTLREQEEVPHYLLDILEPHQEFNANGFLERMDSELKISQVDVALVVGGSGFYLRALLRGTANTEEDAKQAEEAKSRLLEEARNFGYANLYSRLLKLDPSSAGTIHANDHYRIIRALQAMEISGKKWSELNREARSRPPRFPYWAYLALLPAKDELEERIARRSHGMVENGLLEEVEGLLRAGLPKEARSLQSVGYRQALDVLLGAAPKEGLALAVTLATRQLAKRQKTWFRGEELATKFSSALDLKKAALDYLNS